MGALEHPANSPVTAVSDAACPINRRREGELFLIGVSMVVCKPDLSGLQ
jgi:hypothetical protein